MGLPVGEVYYIVATKNFPTVYYGPEAGNSNIWTHSPSRAKRFYDVKDAWHVARQLNGGVIEVSCAYTKVEE